MNCPDCKREMQPQPLGYQCEAKTNEGHMCGTTVGNEDRVRKDSK